MTDRDQALEDAAVDRMWQAVADYEDYGTPVPLDTLVMMESFGFDITYLT